MATKRTTLAQRDAQEIAEIPETHTAPTPQQTPPEPEVDQDPGQQAGEGERSAESVGVYFTTEEFSRARAAFLTDWTQGGSHDTFASWVCAALESYAHAGADQRRETARHLARGSRKLASPRNFTVPAGVMDHVRAAQRDDQRDGRWLSMSAWASDAIAHAADVAQQRAGELVPAPTGRLPGKLTR